MAQLTRLRGDGIPTRKLVSAPVLDLTLSQTLSNLTLSAQATATTGPTGTLSKTLGALTVSATGKVLVEGTAKTSAITLAWDASVGATGYKIYIGTESQTYNYPSSPVNVGNVLIYRLQNLPDDTYYFAVTAYNSALQESGPSNELVDTIVAVDGLQLSSLGLTLVATGMTASVRYGVLSQTLGDLTATGTGNVLLFGTFAQTLSALTLISTGTVTTGPVVPPPPGIYAPAISSHSITAMPSSVYDAIANPAVTYYKVPRGRYTLPTNFVLYNRSNLELDFNGSSIITTPLAYLFLIQAEIDAFVDVSSPTRNASHLTGTISAATTTLTMDAAEIMDVVPGEKVCIVAGTNIYDPVEPAYFLVKTVQSVAGQVITFTEAFGVNIPVYANEAALQAVVAPGLWYKIGPWGDDQSGANYHKGLGTDHGLLRYTVGRNHDITIRNFHLEQTISDDDTLQVGTSAFFAIDTDNLTVKNWSCMNPLGNFFHTWRCNDVLVDRLKIRGTGRSLIGEPDFSATGNLMCDWGSTGLTYRNLDISGRNMVLANMEISSLDVLFQSVRYTMDFDRDWSYASPGVVLGFNGDIAARLEDHIFTITGAGASVDWAFENGNLSTILENPVIVGTTFSDYFYFNRFAIEGTLTWGGIVYGPLVTASTQNIVLSAGSNQTITPPAGFYKFVRLRVTTPGGGTAIWDDHGYDHTAAIASGSWTNMNADHWYALTPNMLPSSYFSLSKFHAHVSGASMTVQFELTYYPKPSSPGWVVS